ncbi:FRG1-like family-domain-containing protein [Obelidium mucronatum]|nr:FRG1-like family-domain-containing protein [Obelidium mucronatum]
MSGKSMRLSFKGDKPKKKRKASGDRDGSGNLDDPSAAEGWANAEAIEHFMGPIMLISVASSAPSCIVSNEKNFSLALQSLGSVDNLDSIEPIHVGQVFLAARLPTGENRISIKSAFDRYLSCDKFGVVTGDKEAVGPYEEWEVVKREDGYCLQSVVKNCYLSSEPDGIEEEDVEEETKKKAASGRSGYGIGGGRICGTIRADSESVGFKEVFKIRCQAQNKVNAHKKKKKEMEDLNAAEVDGDQLKKFQSYGRVAMTEKEGKLLKRAQKQGNLNETLLERREKIKADRYCK